MLTNISSERYSILSFVIISRISGLSYLIIKLYQCKLTPIVEMFYGLVKFSLSVKIPLAVSLLAMKKGTLAGS